MYGRGAEQESPFTNVSLAVLEVVAEFFDRQTNTIGLSAHKNES